MADVRALLAAEKSSRRISHPYATYTKSGVLSCKACGLAIKSEALWEGHLKSANHRKNAAKAAAAQLNQEYSANDRHAQQATQQTRTVTPASASGSSSSSSSSSLPVPVTVTTARNLKRKIEEVDESDTQQEERDFDIDGRKKARPAAEKTSSTRADGLTQQSRAILQTSKIDKSKTGNKRVHFSPNVDASGDTDADVDARSETQHVQMLRAEGAGEGQRASPGTGATETTHRQLNTGSEVGIPVQSSTNSSSSDPNQQSKPIDEEEWAAFESEMTNLESITSSTNALPSSSYRSNPQQNGNATMETSTNIVITAAPVSTQEIQKQQKREEREIQKHKLRDTDMEDEKEDESRRIEEEFEVMQEMEDKVRRLKEKRESLRFPLSTASSLSLLSIPASDDKERSEDEEKEKNQNGHHHRSTQTHTTTATTSNGKTSGGVYGDDDTADDDDDDDDDEEDGTTNASGLSGRSSSNLLSTRVSHTVESTSSSTTVSEKEEEEEDDDDDDEDDWYA